MNKRIAVLPPSGVQVAGLEPSQEAPGLLASGRRAEIFPNIASHLFAAQPANILKLWQGQNLEGLVGVGLSATAETIRFDLPGHHVGPGKS